VAAAATASAAAAAAVKPAVAAPAPNETSADPPRPARLIDAIRDTSGKAAPPAAAPARSDLSSLRSVRSEAYRAPDSAPTFSASPIAGRVGRTVANDDLKRIRGVGVLIEKKLNALGITGYEQIANWTATDIDRVSQSLDFRGRIERENWVEQARILATGGQTEFSRRVDRGEVETSKAKPE
jgi:predicted flap endonuclease-1-like 5' DNA nuclease